MSRLETGQMIGIVVKPNGGVDVFEHAPEKAQQIAPIAGASNENPLTRGQVKRLEDHLAFERRVADLADLAAKGRLGHSRTVRGSFRPKR